MNEITSIDAESLKAQGFTDEELQAVLPKEESEQEPQAEEVKEEVTEEQPTLETETVVEQPAPDGDKVSKHVPYDRFKQKIDEANLLKAELAALKQQQKQQPAPQPAQATQTVSPNEAKAKYFAMLSEQAEAEARQIVGIEKDEDISTLQFTDYRKYQTYLNAMTAIVQEKDQQNRQVWKAQSENTQFIDKLQSDPLFPQVYAYTVAEFDELPLKESKKVTVALNKIGAKQGSKEDFDLVESTFAKYKEKFLASNGQVAQSSTIIAKDITTNPILDKADGLPRAQGLSGSKTAAMSWQQVEQLIIDGKIDQIPKDMLKQIDPKLIE